MIVPEPHDALKSVVFTGAPTRDGSLPSSFAPPFHSGSSDMNAMSECPHDTHVGSPSWFETRDPDVYS